MSNSFRRIILFVNYGQLGRGRWPAKPLKMSTPCPVCNDANTVLVFFKDGIPYFRCGACGFRFTQAISNANFANSIEDYEPAYLEYLSQSEDDEANFSALLDWINTLAPLSGMAVLDVGCGSGKWVRYLRRQSVDARGIEPSGAIYDEYLTGDVHFEHGLLEERDSEPVDVITCFDVLEHTEDPVGLLRACHASLTPGGVLFISTPDTGSVAARLLGRHWHYYNRYHVSYFGRPLLQSLASENGFELRCTSLRGRRYSLSYLIRYGFNFVLGHDAFRLPAFLSRVSVPLNLFDNRYYGFRKR